MITGIFIKLTSSLAIVIFAVMALTSCQQAGRKHENYSGFSNRSYQKTTTIKPNNSNNSSSRNCAGGS